MLNQKNFSCFNLNSLRPFKWLFASLLIPTLLVAQEKSRDPDRVDDSCELGVQPVRVGLSHIQSGGVGYDKGYSSIDLFATPYSHHDALFFVDVRAHRFTNGKFAANGGLGVRYPYLNTNFAYGANFFYDYRRNNEKNLSQLGVGLEVLGRIWKFRTNGYFPIGTRNYDKETSFKRFKGHHLELKEKYKRTLFGIDAEAEARLYSSKNITAFLATGPYYYQGKDSRNAFGGKARLGGTFFNIGNLTAIASYDGLFGFNFQGEIGVSFQLGKKRRILKNNSLRPQTQDCRFAGEMVDTLNQPVQRNEIIVIADQKRTLTAKNPITGEPLFFIHVNNLASPLGGGTFESPYSTLLTAQNNSQAGDIIYVNAGDRSFIGMDQGFTFKDRQQLLGSGIIQTVSTNKGVIDIPALTPGIHPTITNLNALGNGVDLANNNVLSGFNISGPPGHGVFASGVTSGSTIKNNDILDGGTAGGTQAGIRIIMTPGTSLAQPFEISHNLITSVNAGNDGILIDNATGSGNIGLKVNIHHNLIVGNPSEAILIQRANNGMTGEFTLSGSISNNTLQGNGQEGIFITKAAAALPSIILDLNVDSNLITTNGDAGIHFPFARGRLHVTNNFTGLNISQGIFIETVSPDNLVGKVNGNTVNANTSGVSLEVEAGTGSTIDIEFMNNTARFDQMQLDNNTGNPANFRAKVSGNDGQFLSDAITLVP